MNALCPFYYIYYSVTTLSFLKVSFSPTLFSVRTFSYDVIQDVQQKIYPQFKMHIFIAVKTATKIIVDRCYCYEFKSGNQLELKSK